MSGDLKELMATEKTRYLEQCAEKGGTAQGFRARILKQYKKDPDTFNPMLLDALLEAATKKWQQQPRKSGPDLFSFSGVIVPDVLTRPRAAYVNGDEIDEDEEQKFEKVDSRFATVNDYFEDAMIKMRKAAQSSAAAERELRGVDEARRRAHGNMSAFLRDLADEDEEEAA